MSQSTGKTAIRLVQTLLDTSSWASRNPRLRGQSALEVAEHAKEEAGELADAIALDEPVARVAEETFDTISCAFDALVRAGGALDDLERAARKKLQKNRNRRWGPNGRHRS